MSATYAHHLKALSDLRYVLAAAQDAGLPCPTIVSLASDPLDAATLHVGTRAGWDSWEVWVGGESTCSKTIGGSKPEPWTYEALGEVLDVWVRVIWREKPHLPEPCPETQHEWDGMFGPQEVGA